MHARRYTHANTHTPQYQTTERETTNESLKRTQTICALNEAVTQTRQSHERGSHTNEAVTRTRQSHERGSHANQCATAYAAKQAHATTDTQITPTMPYARAARQWGVNGA